MRTTLTIEVWDDATKTRKPHDVLLVIDEQATAQWLGRRAVDSRGGSASLMEGAVIVYDAKRI
jgi:hypothetical protein